MPARPLVDYSLYVLVRLLISCIQALPLDLIQSVSRYCAWLCWHVLRLRRPTVEENLQIAFPEKTQAERDRIALAMWQHLVLMVAEIAHAPRKLHRTNWREHCRAPRMVELIRLLLSERPTVLISGHLGNFELGGYVLGLLGFATHTIARPLDNRYLDRFINEFRGSTGQYMLSKTGSGQQIALLLKQGGTLALLGDQHAGAGACWVEFFGRPASTHKAVAVFTLSGHATTVTCGMLRTGKPLQFEMRPEEIIDPLAEGFQLGSIPQLAHWYTACLERLVRAAPEQYWWVHRRWKGEAVDRRAQRRMLRQSRAA